MFGSCRNAPCLQYLGVIIAAMRHGKSVDELRQKSPWLFYYNRMCIYLEAFKRVGKISSSVTHPHRVCTRQAGKVRSRQFPRVEEG